MINTTYRERPVFLYQDEIDAIYAQGKADGYEDGYSAALKQQFEHTFAMQEQSNKNLALFVESIVDGQMNLDKALGAVGTLLGK